MPDLLPDLRRTIRTLGRQPGFVAAVVGTFAIAIGTNAAMFGLIDRLMLSAPPGILEPERVVRLAVESEAEPGQSARMSTFSYPLFRSLENAHKAFAQVAATRRDTVMVGRDESLRPAAALGVSGDYFRVLGATPQLGRVIGASDDEIPLGQSVAVLGHAYWSRAFGRDPAAIGQQLVIDGTPFTIIGVARSGFNGDQVTPVDIFIPLTSAMRNQAFGWWTIERMNLVSIVGRLAEGVAPPAAAQVVTTLVRAHAPSEDRADRRIAELSPVVPGREARQTAQSQIALWLSGVSIVVLLIATANVGTLMLLRAARRRRETAMRVALGAPRATLGMQLVLESLVLSVAGAALGLLLSRWLSETIRATLLPGLAPRNGFIDGRVAAVSVSAAVLAGLAAALTPIAQIGRRDLASALRAGGESGSSGRMTSQSIMVGVQVALCTVLLIGAGLFVRSLQRVQSQDLGFSTDGIIYVTLDIQGYASGREKDALYESALRRARSVPGVRRASLVQAFPFGPFHVPPINVPGHAGMPTLGGQPPFLYSATPEFLQMMRVSLRQGRLFNERDTRSSPLVAIVNESMARTIWPNESAIGKCIRAGYPADMTGFADPMEAVAFTPCRRVVGIVRDSRARSIRGQGNEAGQMQYYVPFEQTPAPPSPNFSYAGGLFVQADEADLDAIAGTVQRTIQSGLSRTAYVRVRRYQDLIDPQLRSWKLGASLFTLFGALALAIAAVGLFGVISYVVSQRTRELGVRIALGATRRRMWRLVILDALRLVAIGIGAGTLAAMAAGPLVRDMLFRTSPWEPANAIVAIIVLLSVAIVAAALPAWRAGRLDPLTALRADG
jgi:putative ABC transport system permease protein